MIPRRRPQGPGGPARAYRYRFALRRPYRYRNRYSARRPYRYRWVRVDGVAEACRGLGWFG
eukprot:scaffold84802_cov42-Phaeocystis_antarctica.AAC.1